MSTEIRGRRVTAADVAKSLGISRATVGFVLNKTRGQTISEATRKRVISEAARLGYRPHTAAQALARGRSRIILLVLPDWPIEHSMRRHIEEASSVLEGAGYSLVTYTIHDTSRPLWESLDPDVVMGLLPFSEEEVESIRASGISSIVPAPNAHASAWQAGPSIVAGPQLQVEHLVERGHQKIAFAAPGDHRLRFFGEARFNIVAAKALELGLGPVDCSQIHRQDDSPQAVVRKWVDAGFTGIVAFNDEIAGVVASAALRQGLKVPGDIAVIGHDDDPWGELFVPALSTIRMDVEGLGRLLALTALNAVDGTDMPLEEPSAVATLVRRAST